MLRYYRCPSNRFGHGYKENAYVHNEKTTICYFCGKVGHMTSKCRNLHKTWPSNAFKIDKKGPKRIWVPKDKIILITDIFDHKKYTLIMIPG